MPAALRFADLRFGPIYFQPRIVLRDVGYDSNPAGLTGAADPVGDLRATVSPGLKLALPFRQNHLITSDGQLDFLMFRDSEELRGLNVAFGGQYQYTSDRWDLTVAHRYIDASRNQFDTIQIGDEIIPPESQFSRRIRTITNRTTVTPRWDVSNRAYVSATVSRYRVQYPDEPNVALRLDRTEDAIGGAIGYQLLPKTAVALLADWRVDNYEVPGNPREAETNRFAVEIAINPAAVVSGTVVVGYRRLNPFEPDAVGFSGGVGDGSLSFYPGSSLELRFYGGRDTFPALWADSIFAVRQGGGFSPTLQVSRALGLGADISARQDQYPTEATATVQDGSSLTARRLDRWKNFGARVEWGLNRLYGFTFRLGYYERTSNFDTLNTSGLFTGFSYSLVY